MTVATEILSQLGGNRFLAMTGAKNLLDGGAYLQFDLPARFAKDGIDKVLVALKEDDTYTVHFMKWRARAFELDSVSLHDGVYAEDLRRIFTAETGLDTHL